MNDLFEFTDEVKDAVSSGAPVVALESTIITHGMPWPTNAQTALAVEKVVRDGGAVPATIAVMDGKIKVGLSTSEIEELGQNSDVMKLSRADLAFAVSTGKTGSTTVAATMMVAWRAGIDCFATGGIGGVHKDGENTLDVSADLQELAQTSVIVVCAGAKAILDIPRTLEVLETNGVPVIGYQCDEIPAFWSRESGLNAPLRLDSPEALARFWKTRIKLKQAGSVLVTNPVPAESEIPSGEMNQYISSALQDAEINKIYGKDVTPYLLGKIVELTDGRSLETNIALIKNNAKLASEIAVSLSKNTGLSAPIGFNR